MILSDLRKGMTVYIKGYDEDVKINPPYNTFYECRVMGWTDKVAYLEWESDPKPQGRPFTKSINELIERLPENVTQTSKAGVFKESKPQSSNKTEPRPKWPGES